MSPAAVTTTTRMHSTPAILARVSPKGVFAFRRRGRVGFVCRFRAADGFLVGLFLVFAMDWNRRRAPLSQGFGENGAKG
jgi:hypothetical protein